MSGWISCPIQSRHVWAPGLLTLQLAPFALQFEPGQFLNLALDVAGERIKRAYSLASAPGAPAEFYLSLVPGGGLTPALCDLPVGASVWVDPTPQGFFTLKWLPSGVRHLWLVATGTGLGPFVSLWRSGSLFGQFESVTVVHGVRQKAHLGYREELLALAAAEPRLRYVSLLSREAGDAQHLQGRIPERFADGSIERAAGINLDPAQCHIMLCGNPDMIADLTAALAPRGLKRHRQRQPGHLSFEKYW
jgi:ferredoxin/flavodoxin---NADP+ reductase